MASQKVIIKTKATVSLEGIWQVSELSLRCPKGTL